MPIQGTSEIHEHLTEGDRSALLALSVLIERVGRLPQGDRQDLLELVGGLVDAADDDERRSIRRAMEEILAEAPIHSRAMPLTSGPLPEGALKGWVGHVGERIKALRTEAGMTQVELSRKAGLPQSHISRIENAEHSPTRMTLEKIATALGVTVRDLDVSGE